MNGPEPEDTLFEGRPSNPMVWIVPSVLVHVVILVVWLMMPEKPPRKPEQRKLTINREQAERLQRHVEDANLVMLRSQVAELQAIKQAMADIRESKMSKIRDFETERIREAPQDVGEIFTRFLDSGKVLLTTYGKLDQAVQASEARTPDADASKTGAGLEAALPAIREIRDTRAEARRLVETLTQESAVTYALMNTGETQLDWIRNPATATAFTALRDAMQQALEAREKVARTVEGAYGGRAEWSIREVIDRSDDYVGSLKRYEQHVEKGKAEYEAAVAAGGKPKKFVPDKWMKKTADDIRKKIGYFLGRSPDAALIQEAVQAQVEVTRKAGDLLNTIASQSSPVSMEVSE